MTRWRLGVAVVAACAAGAGMLAATGGPSPATARPAPTVLVPSSSLSCQYDPCDSPQQFRVAYGIQPLLARGIDGRGETVSVLVAAAVPSKPPVDIRQDLAGFDRMFGLPAARIEVVASLAGSGSPWAEEEEEVNDLEIAHAVAPAATLRVVLFPRDAIQSPAKGSAAILAGVQLVVSHTDVASISAGLGEHYFSKTQVTEMHSALLEAEAHHVTVIAATGDTGWFSAPTFGNKPVKEVVLPASDPLVLGVGGTTLTLNRATGAYIRETAWPSSGGGFSHLYARPAYQDGVPGISTTRGVPDVAGDADEVGGMARGVVSGGVSGLESDPGTSDSAPLWGGLAALADQYAHHDLGFLNPAIYAIARGSSYHTAFHDVTSGINGYTAGPGWDPITGWGSPNAQVLIPLLARPTSPSKT